MSESLSVDEGWDESLDSDQVTHVKVDAAVSAAASGEWLVNVEDQAVVPMSTTDVVEALRARRISERALVWRVGMQDWAPLGDVPPLRLAVGKLPPPPAPAPIPAPVAARPSSLPPAPSERTLRPPSKEPARAARDERTRKNTLPFGFPAAKDPATVREPAGLQRAPSAKKSEAPAPKREDSGALAVYERAAPSLTFSDSVRAEWQGTNKLVPQSPAPSTPPASASPTSRPLTPRKPILVAPLLEPKLEPKARSASEPSPQPKPRLALEPQSDPVQSARPEPRALPDSARPTHTLAPTTSEPDHERTVRAPMWGDLSVVLASDLRAAQKSSKRVTLVASIGSALLASLLTLWFAHTSSHGGASAPIAAAQPAPIETVKPTAALPEATAAKPAEPSAAPVVTATPSAAATHSAPATTAIAPRARPLVVARVVAKPKPVAAPAPVAAESDTQSPSSDSNPYADPPSVKTPTAAFKEAPEKPAADGSEPKVEPAKSATPKSGPAGDGTSDGDSSGARPAPTAAPGF